ncbi:unnamed protein product [Orchesella dallaii]|uniref:Uncharacterized protein n=1 Tax=Orchesella dallaii TaxID=48710 RepID=A0ABP1S881_9HEXA
MDIKIYFITILLQILLSEFEFSANPVYVDIQHHIIPKSKQMKPFVSVIKNHISKNNGIKSVDGLSDLLKPVQHCLIHMTNFGGIDLPSLDIPTLQMETKLTICIGDVYAVSQSLDLRSNKTSLTCRIEKHGRLKVLKSKCPLSHLFADSTRLCVELNFRKFVTRIRPWTCEVVVSLFPKLVPIPKRSYSYHKKVQIQKIVTVFDQDYYSPHHRFIRRLLPSYAPINMLVTELTNDSVNPQNWDSPNGVGSWFKYSFMDTSNVHTAYNNGISRDNYFVIFTTPSKLKSTFNYKVYSSRIHQICSSYSLQLKLNQGLLVIEFVKVAKFFIGINQEYSTLANMFDSTPIYDFVLYSSSLRDEAGVYKFFYESTCKNMYLKWALEFQHTGSKSYSINWLGEFLQILRRNNYTILYTWDIIICNTKSYTLKIVSNNNFNEFVGRPDLVVLDNRIYPTVVSHPLTFEDSRLTIGFIACGSGKIQNFAFRELFCVFDGYVWACLFTFNLIIIPILWCIIDWLSEKNKPNQNQTAQQSGQQNVLSSRIFFQAVVILLEQGNAFTNKHLNTEAKRWIASVLILAAIVLTNSYKYDNVYKIMLPRKATPFWFFDELQSANFSIYTRTVYRSPQQYNDNLVKRQFASKKYFNFSDHAATIMNNYSGSQVIYSEIVNIVVGDAGQYYFLQQEMLSPWLKENKTEQSSIITSWWSKYSDLFLKILRNTKLHPLEVALAKAFNHEPNSVEQYEEFTREYDRKQAAYFIQILAECQNTAFVLPQATIEKLSSKLRNQGNSKLTVGKEVLMERKMGMVLYGWMSNQLVNTLSRLLAFGIWQHVHNLFGSNMAIISDATVDHSYSFKFQETFWWFL